MKLRFRVSIDDPRDGTLRRFTRDRRWPWAFPPAPGMHVKPDEKLPLIVELRDVIFDPENEVVLADFTSDGLNGDIDARLDSFRRLGWTEMPPVAGRPERSAG